MSVERGATARCNEYDVSFLCGVAVDMVHLSPVTFQVAFDIVDPSSVNIQVNLPSFILLVQGVIQQCILSTARTWGLRQSVGPPETESDKSYKKVRRTEAD